MTPIPLVPPTTYLCSLSFVADKIASGEAVGGMAEEIGLGERVSVGLGAALDEGAVVGLGVRTGGVAVAVGVCRGNAVGASLADVVGSGVLVPPLFDPTSNGEALVRVGEGTTWVEAVWAESGRPVGGDEKLMPPEITTAIKASTTTRPPISKSLLLFTNHRPSV